MIEAQNPNHDGFSEQFKSTSRCATLLETSEAFLKARPKLTDERFLQLFTGRLFEELAFLNFFDTLGPGLKLLDPTETLQAFRNLYGDGASPRKAFQEFGDGYVPDGLLLRAGDGGYKVVSLIEYSAQKSDKTDDNYVRDKRKRVMVLRQRYPQIFGKSGLDIILPLGTRFHSPRLDGQTSLGSVPYTYDQVRRLASELVPKRSATVVV